MGVAVVEATCDGSGLCPAEQNQDCGLFGCEAAALVCDGGCADDPSACAAGEYCSAGICVTEKTDGSTCGSDAQCTSGHCVDGYCCDTACTDQCAACNVRRSEGTCTANLGATQGGRAACLGSGTCGAVCDGTNTTDCSFPSAEITCGDAKCDGGIISDTPSCNGEGRCAVGTISACPSLLCDGAECAEACVEDSDCPGDKICVDGGCIADPLIHADDKGSCGCRIPGQKSPWKPGEPLLLLAPLLLMAWRRRRVAP